MVGLFKELSVDGRQQWIIDTKYYTAIIECHYHNEVISDTSHELVVQPQALLFMFDPISEYQTDLDKWASYLQNCDVGVALALAISSDTQLDEDEFMEKGFELIVLESSTISNQRSVCLLNGILRMIYSF